MRHPPAARPGPVPNAALDVVVWSKMLMVAYAAEGGAVVVARGSDLAAMAILRAPDSAVAGPALEATALAFRQSDASLAVAFGDQVVSFGGWRDNCNDTTPTRHEDSAQVIIKLQPGIQHYAPSTSPCSNTITSLSFSADGRRLAVVGPDIGLSVFQQSKTSDEEACWTLIFNVSSESVIGKISPDGALLAVAGLFSRVVQVWRLADEAHIHSAISQNPVLSPVSFNAIRKNYSGQTLSLSESVETPPPALTDPKEQAVDLGPSPFAELTVGASGVSTMSWKPRGGGQPVLLTTDRNGSLRLWAKIPRIAANAPTAWMEEIARTPHFAGTNSSAADFVHWGGGGGVAVDEADALATSALYPFLAQGAVPKPSRTLHWIVSVAGADMAAWQARGLDDRPRAAYARLEPGAKNSSLMERAMNGSGNVSSSIRQPHSTRNILTGDVLAVRCVAPEPLTLTSAETDRLVRSYAISNAEKSLRSPEPPTPPEAAATFILTANRGLISVSRWDLCPTSDSQAICRAKVGEGHVSHIVDIQVAAGSGSIEAAASGGRGRITAASIGAQGDVLLWRTDASSVFKPLTFGGRLPGPHSALAFPELCLSDKCYSNLFVAADPIRRTLHAYRIRETDHLVARVGVVRPIRVSSCVELKRIIKLQMIPEYPSTITDSGQASPVSSQIVLGLFEQSDRLGAWKLSSGPTNGATKLGPVELKRIMFSIDGTLHESRVTAFAVSESVLGVQDESPSIALGSITGHVQICRLVPSSKDRVQLEEVRVLGTRTATECGAVCGVAVGKQGLRVAVIRKNGNLTVWEKNSASGRWKRELHRRVVSTESSAGHVRGSQLAFGTDPLGHTYLAVSCSDLGRRRIELFVKRQGVAWVANATFGESELQQSGQMARVGSCIGFTGPGIVALSDGSSLLSFSTTCASLAAVDESSALSVVPDLFKSTGMSSFIHTGGSALQALTVLKELYEELQRGSVDGDEGIEFPSFSVVPPPPPSLHILLARGAALQAYTASAANFTNYGKLADLLGETTIRGLSATNRDSLVALARGAARVGPALASLDQCGSSFALAASALLANPDPSKSLASAVIAEALNSTAKDALADIFVKQGDKKSSMWDTCRRLGIGYWLNTSEHAKKLAEKIARTAFATTQNPDDAALWYICLGRRSALATLYRAKSNQRMYQFMTRNFKEKDNRIAAEKNAYVLVSKRRYELAAAFFALGGNATAATNLLLTRSNDPQLALVIARLLDDFGELRFLVNEGSLPASKQVLEEIISIAATNRDDHTKALAESLLGRHNEALATAVSSFEVSDDGDFAVDMINGDLVGVLTLGHVFAICSRPPLVGSPESEVAIHDCRTKAGASLAAEGFPAAALAVYLDSLRNLPKKMDDIRMAVERSAMDVLKSCLKHRSLLHTQASLGNGKRILRDITGDLTYLIAESGLERESILQNAKMASVELGLYDESDAAVLLCMASCSIPQHSSENGPWTTRGPLDDVMSIASSRALEIVEANLFQGLDAKSRSFFSTPARQYQGLKTILRACKAIPAGSDLILENGVGTLRRTCYVLRICNAFISGHWKPIESNLQLLIDDEGDGLHGTGDAADSSMRGNSLLFNSTKSMEDMRKAASSPAALTPNRRGVSRRTIRVSLSLLSTMSSGGSSPTMGGAISPVGSLDLNMMTRLANEEENQSEMAKPRHPLMNYALGSAALCTAAAHVAHVASIPHIWSSRFLSRFRHAAEHLEASAVDALHGWIPLATFGTLELQPNYNPRSVESYSKLWRMLCGVGEFACTMSEAATVAAAAASWAKEQEAAEHRKSTRKQKKQRKPSDSVDSYPVRFSNSSTGPWSGHGNHLVIHQEVGELIRSLCVSSSDPPAIVIATPRGVVEVTPSSYVFRPSAPGSPGASFEGASELGRRVNVTKLEHKVQQASLMSPPRSATRRHEPASVWRNRAESTAVTAHPYRRRYASGGRDGVVMLWGHGEAAPVGELHQPRPKVNSRVATLKYSAYAESLLGVFVSGQVVIWHDPDHQATGSGLRGRAASGPAYRIEAFGHRRASDGVFLDERNTVAVVGDPGGVSSAGAHAVGHSLRVFDLREPGAQTAQPRATWTCRVHGGTEARCLSLLEDRVRIVTGGVDGSLSIVDTRARACIAEQLPAHKEEVVCMTLEHPRGRALATGCHGGKVRLWDSRTLMSLDTISEAHVPTRHLWSGGTGFGGVLGGIHGVKSLHLTDRALMSCGGDGAVKIWGPGWGDFDHLVL